ncbi:hypothetical protein CCC13826_1686 (plasmid) [Campylobacter concisus 13826]|uniref:Uncharacterized protein n=1 Tax=Campylobacter concisus (strain 13826) TaxID=360104 RepID=A7ZGH6_CAMC1|nr:hypothetical protein CCC13826_1686 [Campylobacter concisus 13826]
MELAMSLKKNMQALMKIQKMIVFLYYKKIFNLKVNNIS